MDLLTNKVTVFNLAERLYKPAEFTGYDKILSGTFSELELTVDRILTAGK